MNLVSKTPNGIRIDGDVQVLLDPRNAGAGINFVSHAHSDHLPISTGGTILTSRDTARLAFLRGRDMNGSIESMDGLRLYDSGHILGSKGLLFNGVFYTGDICTRDRGFLRGASVPKCDVLITECTFGLPEFSFPSLEQIRDRVDELVSALYTRGVPVVLMGYALGKAQVLSQMFAHWEPMYYHDSVKEMNDAHRSLGVPIRDAPGYAGARAGGLLDKKPWIMVAPMLGPKSRFIIEMKKYGAVTVSFTGWAGSARFQYSRGADYTFPMSDHCDFAELLRLVEASGARHVYTVHGFAEEFARTLAKRGISASPLAAG